MKAHLIIGVKRVFHLGITQEQALNMANRMGFSESSHDQAAEYIMKMYNLFIEKDATLIEINPMCEDAEGNGECVDEQHRTTSSEYL